MNDMEVGKQVQQMVQFIRQEAEEKANEISVSAEEVRGLRLCIEFASLVIYFCEVVERLKFSSSNFFVTELLFGVFLFVTRF